MESARAEYVVDRVDADGYEPDVIDGAQVGEIHQIEPVDLADQLDVCVWRADPATYDYLFESDGVPRRRRRGDGRASRQWREDRPAGGDVGTSVPAHDHLDDHAAVEKIHGDRELTQVKPAAADRWRPAPRPRLRPRGVDRRSTLPRTRGPQRGMPAPDQIQPGHRHGGRDFKLVRTGLRDRRRPPHQRAAGTHTRARCARRGQAEGPARRKRETLTSCCSSRKCTSGRWTTRRAVGGVQLQRRDRRDAHFPHHLSTSKS